MKFPAERPSPASKPVLAVDIDEVLIPLGYEFFRFVGDKYNQPLKLENGFDYFGTHRLLGISKTEILADLDVFYNSPQFAETHPLDGAIEGIHRLSQSYEMVIITSRPTDARMITERWLEQHFPQLFRDVHLVGFVGSHANAVPKHELIEKIDAIGLVDDTIKNVADVAASGRKGILFGEYEWNHADELPTGVVRARNWAEVEELLLD